MKARVLIVDDDATLRRALTDRLEYWGLDVQEAADGGFADSRQQLDGFHGLQATDDAGEDAEDSAFGAIRHGAGLGWVWEKTAVAGAAQMRGKNRDLSLEAEDRSVDVGDTEKNGDVVAEVAGGEVVGAVDEEIVSARDLHGVLRAENIVDGGDLDVRIQVTQPGTGGLELQAALRAPGNSPPLIFITAQDDPDAERQALNNGAVAFLRKPFDEHVLLDAIDAAAARANG